MSALMRGAIRLHVLHHAAEDQVHGAWMTAELERHGYRISPGTLYPTLHRMEEEGLLTSLRVVTDGRSRRVYEITTAGRLALTEGIDTLRELAHELLRIPREVLESHDDNPDETRQGDGRQAQLPASRPEASAP